MHDPVVVGGLKGVRNLDRNLERLTNGQPATGEADGQIVAVHELHHQSGGRFDNTVHLCEGGIVQRGENLRLALETSTTFRVLGKKIGKDFDRHVAMQLAVASAVHLPHSAGPKRGEDFVWAQARADR